MSHSKSPPSLPQIVDEAGDSPRWLPLLGAFVFALLAFMAFFAAWSESRHGAEDPAAMARDDDTHQGE